MTIVGKAAYLDISSSRKVLEPKDKWDLILLCVLSSGELCVNVTERRRICEEVLLVIPGSELLTIKEWSSINYTEACCFKLAACYIIH